MPVWFCPQPIEPAPTMGRSAIIVRLPKTIRNADVQANHIRVLTSKDYLKDILATTVIKP